MGWRSDAFHDWFDESRTNSATYRQLRLTERPEKRPEGIAELARLAAEAHRDAKERLEELLGISLSPSTPDGTSPTPVSQYPEGLDTTTLQGYLGEVFAGLLAENFAPHDKPWTVPAFIFRAHVAAPQALERRRQLGGPAHPIPGRTGDDALAFVTDEDGAIVAWLYGEAKCTADHNSQLIAAGHKQLSSPIYVPVDLLALIEVLQARADEVAERWVTALRQLLFVDQASAPKRFDMFVYVCGRSPKQADDWLPTLAPHSGYSGTGPLEAVEVHLEQFDAVLTAAYPGHTVSRG
jgi:hypothetical protein